MAFKSMETYNKERFNNLFILANDGDYAEVIFLYEKYGDVLGADAHYIKSSEYSGYVHCCESGCPACAKGIRVQPKLFIPLYNLTTGAIEFWDRNMRFDAQLQHDVFQNYPNPSQYVWRIVRHGARGDINTTYSIQVVGMAPVTFEKILADHKISFPDYYSTIVKEFAPSDMMRMLNSSAEGGFSSSNGSLPEYKITPRVTTPQPTVDVMPPFKNPDQPAQVEFPTPEVPAADVSNETVEDNVDF